MQQGKGHDKVPLKIMKIQSFNSHGDLANTSKSNSVRTKSKFKQIELKLYFLFCFYYCYRPSVTLCSHYKCQVDLHYNISNDPTKKKKKNQVLKSYTVCNPHSVQSADTALQNYKTLYFSVVEFFPDHGRLNDHFHFLEVLNRIFLSTVDLRKQATDFVFDCMNSGIHLQHTGFKYSKYSSSEILTLKRKQLPKHFNENSSLHLSCTKL